MSITEEEAKLLLQGVLPGAPPPPTAHIEVDVPRSIRPRIAETEDLEDLLMEQQAAAEADANALLSGIGPKVTADPKKALSLAAQDTTDLLSNQLGKMYSPVMSGALEAVAKTTGFQAIKDFIDPSVFARDTREFSPEGEQAINTLAGSIGVTPGTEAHKILRDMLAPSLFAIDGLLMGLDTANERTQNAANLVADLFGLERTKLFQEFEKRLLTGEARPDNVADLAWSAIGAALVELPQWGVAAGLGTLLGGAFSIKKAIDTTSLPARLGFGAGVHKALGGVAGTAALGAITEIDEGREAAAHAAAEYALMHGALTVTAPLYHTTRMAIMGGLFSSQAKLTGATDEETFAAGITGMVLSTLGGKGQDRLTFSNLIREKVMESPKFRETMRLKGIHARAQMEVTEAFLKEHYPELYDQIRSELAQRDDSIEPVEVFRGQKVVPGVDESTIVTRSELPSFSVDRRVAEVFADTSGETGQALRITVDEGRVSSEIVGQPQRVSRVESFLLNIRNPLRLAGQKIKTQHGETLPIRMTYKEVLDALGPLSKEQQALLDKIVLTLDRTERAVLDQSLTRADTSWREDGNLVLINKLVENPDFIQLAKKKGFDSFEFADPIPLLPGQKARDFGFETSAETIFEFSTTAYKPFDRSQIRVNRDIRLTEEQFAEIKAQSKIKTPEGELQVVFRGETAGDPQSTGLQVNTQHPRQTFSAHPRVSEAFVTGQTVEGGATQGRVGRFYLDIRNPLEIKGSVEGQPNKVSLRDLINAFTKNATDPVSRAKARNDILEWDRNEFTFFSREDSVRSESPDAFELADNAHFIELAQRYGFDGIVFRDPQPMTLIKARAERENVSIFDTLGETETAFVPFSDSQIIPALGKPTRSASEPKVTSLKGKASDRPFEQVYMDWLADELRIPKESEIGLVGRLSMLLKRDSPSMSHAKRNFLVNTWAADIRNSSRRILKKEETATPEQTQAERDAAFTRHENRLQQNEESLKKMSVPAITRFRRLIQEGFFDVAANARRALRKLADEGIPEAQIAIENYNARAGATVAAKQAFLQAKKDIFGIRNPFRSPTEEQARDVSNVAFARVLAGLGSRKAKLVYKSFLGKKAIDDAILWYFELPNKWGVDKFELVEGQAIRLSNHFKKALRLLKEEGLISEEAFSKMENIDYLPLQHLQKLDPLRDVDIGPRTLTVTESGVRFLDKGGKGIVNMNAFDLLQQHLVRVHSRIAKNRANRSLLTIARQNPGNKLFKTVTAKEAARLKWDRAGKLMPKVKKGIDTPFGYSRVSLFENGKEQLVFLRQDFKRGWVDLVPAVSGNFANALRIASGSAILRPLATGYNPAFIIANFPRDVMHAWLASGEYSVVLPTFLGQMTRDLAVTAKDAWAHRGRWEEYMAEGGGMNFLTHQGMDILGFKNQLFRPLDPHMTGKGAIGEKTKNTLAYLNEVSEIWVRLAIRERNLRNVTGDKPSTATPQQKRSATASARDYLDFSQGGNFSKAIDHFVPYFNASMQALRTTARAAKRDPEAFAFQVAQLMLLDSIAYYSSWIRDPEGLAQINNHTRDTNFIVTLGTWHIDLQGNKRHHYLAIPYDQTLAPFTMVNRGVLERWSFGRPRVEYDRSLLERVGQISKALPFIPEGIPIPTFAAAVALMANYDDHFERDIWGGPEVPYEQELIEPGTLSKPTPIVWRTMAEFFGLLGDNVAASPIRMEAAMRKIIPNNPLTMSFLNVADWAAYPEDEMRRRHLEFGQKMAETPFVNRVFKTTHPDERLADLLEDAGKHANATSLQQNRTLDRTYLDMKEGKVSRAEAIRSIQQGDYLFSDKDRMLDRFLTAEKIDRLFPKTADIDLPGMRSRRWWLNLKRFPAHERAEVFYQTWREAESPDKGRMHKLAVQLGYFNDPYGEFHRRFQELKKLGGSERDN